MRWRVLRLLLAGLALAGCQTSRDAMPGVSGSAVIAVDRADLNLPIFLNTKGVEVERQGQSNGGAVINRYRKDGRIFAFTQRVRTTWLTIAAEQQLGRPEHLAELTRTAAHLYAADNPKKAPKNRNGRTVGYYSDNGICAAFAIGVKMRTGTHYDNDQGQIDTIVRFAGYSLLTEDVKSVIAKLGRPTEAERAAMRATGG